MAAITYGVAPIRAPKVAKRAKSAAPRKGVFARFIDALVESRLQSAHREIVKYAPTQDRNITFGG
jgi:hypothetical protein